MTSAMENPYQSPNVGPSVASPRYSAVRIALFFVNFAVAVFFAIICILNVAVPQSPFAVIGGMIGLVPVIIYALAEWIAFYSRKVAVERALGYANLGCAVFVAFGVVTNVGEALISDDPSRFQFIFWFTLIGVSIAGYLLASGWCRLRWTRNSDSRGFQR